MLYLFNWEIECFFLARNNPFIEHYNVLVYYAIIAVNITLVNITKAPKNIKGSLQILLGRVDFTCKCKIRKTISREYMHKKKKISILPRLQPASFRNMYDSFMHIVEHM